MALKSAIRDMTADQVARIIDPLAYRYHIGDLAIDTGLTRRPTRMQVMADRWELALCHAERVLTALAAERTNFEGEILTHDYAVQKQHGSGETITYLGHLETGAHGARWVAGQMGGQLLERLVTAWRPVAPVDPEHH